MQQFKTMNIKGREYETVKARKARFYSKFPDGRIVATLVEASDKHALMKVEVYRDCEEQVKNCVFSSGHAMEFRQTKGANSTSWLENCEESAVGRALDNAGFASMMSCSYEEIVVAESNRDALEDPEEVSGDIPEFIQAAQTIPELMAVWKQLSQEDKKLHTEKFSARKEELSCM